MPVTSSPQNEWRSPRGGDTLSLPDEQYSPSRLDPQRPRRSAYRVPEYNLSRGRLKEARQQIEAVRALDPDNVGA